MRKQQQPKEDPPMDQRFVDLYDEYTHRPLDRRVFLERLVALAGSVTAAQAILSAIEPSYAHASVVAADDPRIGATSLDLPAAELKGYLAFPKAKGPEIVQNLVIVIHENRGLNPYVQDVARRLAIEGFHAFAPDFLTPQGGTPQDPDQARDMIAKADMPKVVSSTAAVIASFKAKSPSLKVGAVGFCWGGGVVNTLATTTPALDAGVVFYGVAPKVEDVSKIKASLIMHHASLDARVNATLPPYEAALKAANIAYQLYMYEGVNHAFHNETSAERYNDVAAKLAWQRTVDFFKTKLA
jgi:carboxymethylenebutenolidase